MENRKFGMITSSQNPEEIATKVKGAVLMFSSLIIFFAGQFFHLTLTANDVASMATEISGVAGAVWLIYGVVLHLLSIVFKKPTV